MGIRSWLQIDLWTQGILIALQALCLTPWVILELTQKPLPLLMLIFMFLMIPLGIYQVGISTVIYYLNGHQQAPLEVKRWRLYHIIAIGLALGLWWLIYSISFGEGEWALTIGFLGLWLTAYICAYATYLHFRSL
ncbi:hypothetical protein [Eisenibacter elegans]|uniref:hypothetical protein n=1 Tax=Eisenibacter elegans TaxID=997 RepID=UPI000410A848|nr:hypothetical protein [Eisenibacter elegans]